MAIEITFRNVVVSEAVQIHANEKAEKLMQDFGSIEYVRIVLSKDGPFYAAEVQVQGGRSRNAESSFKDAELLPAINAAVERAETQIRKQIEKQQNTR